MKSCLHFIIFAKNILKKTEVLFTIGLLGKMYKNRPVWIKRKFEKYFSDLDYIDFLLETGFNFVAHMADSGVIKREYLKIQNYFRGKS